MPAIDQPHLDLDRLLGGAHWDDGVGRVHPDPDLRHDHELPRFVAVGQSRLPPCHHLPHLHRHVIDPVARHGHGRRRLRRATEKPRIFHPVASLADRVACEVGSAEWGVFGHRCREVPPRDGVPTERGGRRRFDCGDRPPVSRLDGDLVHDDLHSARVHQLRPDPERLTRRDGLEGRGWSEARKAPLRVLVVPGTGPGREGQAEGGLNRILELPLLHLEHEDRVRLRREGLEGRAGGGQAAGKSRDGGFRLLEAEGRDCGVHVRIDGRQGLAGPVGLRLVQCGEETRQARVDAIEEAQLLWRCVDEALDPLVVSEDVAGSLPPATAHLGALKAQAEVGELLVRAAQPGTVLPGVRPERPVFVFPGATHVELEGLPRTQALFDLLRKGLRVPGQVERLLRHETGGLVLAVAVPFVALEARDDDEGPGHPNHPHEVAQDGLPTPLVQRFLEPLRVAVVGGRGEILLVDAVVLIGQQQLLGPDETEAIEELGADGVVPALAAVQRHERDPNPVPPAQHRQDAAVLVVRVGCRVKGAGGRLQLE